jgi:uncharacterized protein HemX
MVEKQTEKKIKLFCPEHDIEFCFTIFVMLTAAMNALVRHQTNSYTPQLKHVQNSVSLFYNIKSQRKGTSYQIHKYQRKHM